ncbi:hypothetical protein QBC46DRAFT_251162 [Diplogelasinospora grovesii]|uniref:RBR-type E3 ubiquitin transferase n=1 Tax=Diplogelasinospora grovesii TaxID=303347 RepID=A0AAN6NJR2_9PEZI|nr:hypothetical protein QBC46DRAFT_251162 [Diplogelasinospora grovesii]
MEEKPPHKTAQLSCGHSMCHSCLKRSFTLSISDPQHMPPRCCTSDVISLRHVEKLFDPSFKQQWNRKFAEYSTRNRVYCPSRRCGEWIRPEDIRRSEDGRKVGKCARCRTKVCGRCSGRWHAGVCPRDEDTAMFLEQAKREGWQRCYRCKHMVELKEGCVHMICRCGAAFCMTCGSKWKSCDCPWFNDEPLEDEDPLEQMGIPGGSRQNPFAGGARYPPERSSRYDAAPLYDAPPSPRFDGGPPSPRDYRSEVGPPASAAVRPRPSSYEEEMLLHKLQEDRDEHLARRMQHPYDDEDIDHDFDRDMENDFLGLGHREPADRGRVKDEYNDYRRRPRNIEVPAPPPPPLPMDPPSHPSYERAASYVSGVNRARGMRPPSPETRWRAAPSPERRPSPERGWGRPPSPERFDKPVRRSSSLERRMMPPEPEMDVYTSSRSSEPSGRHHHNHHHSHSYHAQPAHVRQPPPPQLHHSHSHQHTHNHNHNHHHQQQLETAASLSAGSPHAPNVRRRPPRGGGDADHHHREHTKEPPKQSVLAGLTGPGRGMNRVFEWRNFVEPGISEPGDSNTSMISEIAPPTVSSVTS